MTGTEEKIIQAAIQTFVRYGARKTTMGDIAEAAEVSRQTVYASFNNKDGMIVASLRYATNASLATVRDRLMDCATLGDALDAYFAETVVKAYALIQTSPDAEDLMNGHNKAGKAEIRAGYKQHEALMAEILLPHSTGIVASGHTVPSFAHFVVTVVMGLKHGAENTDDLAALLQTLKATVLRVADTQ